MEEVMDHEHEEPEDEAYLPYNGSSGHSGGDSSRERAEYADRSGLTARRHREALFAVYDAGVKGVTYKELGDHGWASGALSRLQQKGVITRVRERRNGAEVYVLPEHVGDREVVAYRPQAKVVVTAAPVVEPVVTPLPEARAAAERVRAKVEGAKTSAFVRDLLWVLEDYDRLSK